MITTAKFYSLPVSIASGEYPLFPTEDIPSSYLVHTVSDVKVTHDMDQDLKIPTFDGYETVSVVYLDNIGVYWVTGVDTSTVYNATLVFHLRYNAVSSNIHKGESIKGIWTRRPTLDPKVSQAVSNSPMTAKLLAKLPTMSAVTMVTNTYQGFSANLYWVQITSSAYIDADGNVTNGKITRYGTFAIFGSETNSISTFVAYDSTSSLTDSIHYAYPTICDIYNNLTGVTGIESSSVLDISVIPICPYNFSERFWSDGSKSGSYTVLTDSSGNDIIPTIGKDITYNSVLSTKVTYKFRVYNLDMSSNIESIVDMYYANERTSDTITFSLSDLYQNTGQIEVRDWCGNAIGSIANTGKSYSLSIRYISDNTGIYTVINNGETNNRIIIPSAKIPWIGTQWETYKAYSMDTDRKSIEFAQSQYDKQLQSDIANSIFNGVIGAGIMGATGVGAVVGGTASVTSGAVSGLLGRELNNQKLQQDQELTEMRVKASPAVTYSTAYGLNQIKLMELYGGGIYILTPHNVDESYYADYTTEFGYATEGVQTLTINGGYYKGRILAADGMSGIIFDRLQYEFNSGLKLKEF